MKKLIFLLTLLVALFTVCGQATSKMMRFTVQEAPEGYHSIQDLMELNRDKPEDTEEADTSSSFNYYGKAVKIVIIALASGVVLSAILAFLYINFIFKKSEKAKNQHHSPICEYTSHTEEYDEFDYPYEDIGKVTGI